MAYVANLRFEVESCRQYLAELFHSVQLCVWVIGCIDAVDSGYQGETMNGTLVTAFSLDGMTLHGNREHFPVPQTI